MFMTSEESECHFLYCHFVKKCRYYRPEISLVYIKFPKWIFHNVHLKNINKCISTMRVKIIALCLYETAQNRNHVIRLKIGILYTAKLWSRMLSYILSCSDGLGKHRWPILVSYLQEWYFIRSLFSFQCYLTMKKRTLKKDL